MTDATKLFRSGKRYRGFAPMDDSLMPVSFNVYPVDQKRVKLKYIFPTVMFSKLGRGSVIYTLVEDGEYMIAELRVVERDEERKSTLASLDFVTEDRRKLPRVRVKGFLEVKARLRCGEGELSGDVIDMSMASLSVETRTALSPQECEVELAYKSYRVSVKGRIIRSAEGSAIVEITDGNGDFANFLSRIYSDLFLKVQRSS